MAEMVQRNKLQQASMSACVSFEEWTKLIWWFTYDNSIRFLLVRVKKEK